MYWEGFEIIEEFERLRDDNFGQKIKQVKNAMKEGDPVYQGRPFSCSGGILLLLGWCFGKTWNQSRIAPIELIHIDAKLNLYLLSRHLRSFRLLNDKTRCRYEKSQYFWCHRFPPLFIF